VVRQFLGPRDAYFVKLADGQPASRLPAWMTRDAGAKLLARRAGSLDELLAASDKPDFKPITLDITIRGHLRSKVRELIRASVVAMVPAAIPFEREVVIFSGALGLSRHPPTR